MTKTLAAAAALMLMFALPATAADAPPAAAPAPAAAPVDDTALSLGEAWSDMIKGQVNARNALNSILLEREGMQRQIAMIMKLCGDRCTPPSKPAEPAKPTEPAAKE